MAGNKKIYKIYMYIEREMEKKKQEREKGRKGEWGREGERGGERELLYVSPTVTKKKPIVDKK